MKAKLSYILVFCLLSLLPHYVQAAEAKHDSVAAHSLQKYNSQNTTALSASSLSINEVVTADLDVDDDDFSLSAKKRIAFERTAHFAAAFYISRFTSVAPQHQYCIPQIDRLSSSRYISLRVFRI